MLLSKDMKRPRFDFRMFAALALIMSAGGAVSSLSATAESAAAEPLALSNRIPAGSVNPATNAMAGTRPVPKSRRADLPDNPSVSSRSNSFPMAGPPQPSVRGREERRPARVRGPISPPSGMDMGMLRSNAAPIELPLLRSIAHLEEELARPDLDPSQRKTSEALLNERRTQVADLQKNGQLWQNLHQAELAGSPKTVAQASQALADYLIAWLGRMEGRTYSSGMSLDAVMKEYQRHAAGGVLDPHNSTNRMIQRPP